LGAGDARQHGGKQQNKGTTAIRSIHGIDLP
jgi:hypothetical protein